MSEPAIAVSSPDRTERPRVLTILDEIVGALAIAFTTLFSVALRPFYARWGMRRAELAREFPGDALVKAPNLSSTLGITIAAPPADVWAWLVQIGHGRGGLYTYTGLENLAGCDLHNLDRLDPRVGEIYPGMLVRMGPPGYPTFRVVSITPHEALVMRAYDEAASEPFPLTWTFAIEPFEGGSRLFARRRASLRGAMYFGFRYLVDPVSFVMERKMLIGIKRRAEGRIAAR